MAATATQMIGNGQKGGLYMGGKDRVLILMNDGLDYAGKSIAEIVKVNDDLGLNEDLKPVMGFNVNVNKNV